MADALVLRRGLKVLHEIGAVGVMGGLAACLVVAGTANAAAAAEFAAARRAVAAIATWMLVPSLALVLITGLLAIAFHKGYHDAGWAWVKALLGIVVFEATLVTVAAASQESELAALIASGSDPALLASMLRSERTTLWLLLGLSVANVVLAVWRPRLLRKPPS